MHFLQLHRSTGIEEIVNPIYCKAGKRLVYKQAEKKSMRESKTPYSMTIERQLYLLPSGFYLFFMWLSFVYVSSLILHG